MIASTLPGESSTTTTSTTITTGTTTTTTTNYTTQTTATTTSGTTNGVNCDTSCSELCQGMSSGAQVSDGCCDCHSYCVCPLPNRISCNGDQLFCNIQQKCVDQSLCTDECCNKFHSVFQ